MLLAFFEARPSKDGSMIHTHEDVHVRRIDLDLSAGHRMRWLLQVASLHASSPVQPSGDLCYVDQCFAMAVHQDSHDHKIGQRKISSMLRSSKLLLVSQTFVIRKFLSSDVVQRACSKILFQQKNMSSLSQQNWTLRSFILQVFFPKWLRQRRE